MSSRTLLIAGNWKMHKTGSQAVEAASRLKILVKTAADFEVMIAPTYTARYQVAQALKDSALVLGAQDLHWEKQGAFTGKISSEMLVDAGCSHVIIGHSERRQFFGKTDATVNRKINRAHATDLIPSLWAGEAEARLESGEVFSVLEKQVCFGLKGSVFNVPDGLVVPYELLWAIGSGKTKKVKHGQIEYHDEIECNNFVVCNEKGSIDPRLILFFLMALLFITYVVLIISNRPVPDSLNAHIDAILCYIIGYLSNLPSR